MIGNLGWGIVSIVTIAAAFVSVPLVVDWRTRRAQKRRGYYNGRSHGPGAGPKR